MSYTPPGQDPYGQQPDPYAQPQQPNPYGQPVSPAPQPYGQPELQQPYAQPWSAAPVKQNNGLALAAMIVGIISIPSACCALLGVAVGAAAAIMGHISMKQIAQQGQSNRSHALTGIITGYVGVGLGILNGIAGLVLNLNGGFGSF
ncbi:DUF4190 domain-containing protein [Catellatospora vulcania]|uniref:DUF4190 domain-containing protein n=1 Tax=Catellatospora vulcania TaxID=1460450 RepID=UPI0012D3DEE4|nr:DUF4190 domain-containing protein [Catellatospora vulcania]